MWLLPKCENVCIVDSLDHKYVQWLESKKEWEEQIKKQHQEMAKKIYFNNLMYGIFNNGK